MEEFTGLEQGDLPSELTTEVGQLPANADRNRGGDGFKF